MRLVIVSHTEHYIKEGKVFGWGPTVREINHLANIFSEVVHVAPLHPGEVPSHALPYGAPNIVFSPVPPAGGEGLFDKLSILAALPIYMKAMLREFRKADVVHV